MYSVCYQQCKHLGIPIFVLYTEKKAYHYVNDFGKSCVTRYTHCFKIGRKHHATILMQLIMTWWPVLLLAMQLPVPYYCFCLQI